MTNYLTMYEIDEELRAFQQDMLENPDDPNNEYRFKALAIGAEKTVGQSTLIIKEIEAQQAILKEHQAKIAARIKYLEMNKSKIKKWQCEIMGEFDIKKVEDVFANTIRIDGKPKIVVIDEDLVPDDYKKKRITVTIDKAKMQNTYDLTNIEIAGTKVEINPYVMIREKVKKLTEG